MVECGCRQSVAGAGEEWTVRMRRKTDEVGENEGDEAELGAGGCAGDDERCPVAVFVVLGVCDEDEEGNWVRRWKGSRVEDWVVGWVVDVEQGED